MIPPRVEQTLQALANKTAPQETLASYGWALCAAAALHDQKEALRTILHAVLVHAIVGEASIPRALWDQALQTLIDTEDEA